MASGVPSANVRTAPESAMALSWEGGGIDHRIGYNADRASTIRAPRPGGALWSSKYRVREQLRREVGGLGNCCVHLTDNQAAALDGRGARGGGYACDSSYAYHCARVLLDESSVRFLAEADADAPAFEERFAAYESWLAREDAPVGGAPSFVV